MVGSRIKRL